MQLTILSTLDARKTSTFISLENMRSLRGSPNNGSREIKIGEENSGRQWKTVENTEIRFEEREKTARDGLRVICYRKDYDIDSLGSRREASGQGMSTTLMQDFTASHKLDLREVRKL